MKHESNFSKSQAGKTRRFTRRAAIARKAAFFTMR